MTSRSESSGPFSHVTSKVPCLLPQLHLTDYHLPRLRRPPVGYLSPFAGWKTLPWRSGTPTLRCDGTIWPILCSSFAMLDVSAIAPGELGRSPCIQLVRFIAVQTDVTTNSDSSQRVVPQHHGQNNTCHDACFSALLLHCWEEPLSVACWMSPRVNARCMNGSDSRIPGKRRARICLPCRGEVSSSSLLSRSTSQLKTAHLISIRSFFFSWFG